MKLEYSRRAQKDIKKLPVSKIKFILLKTDLLKSSPFVGKKLGGKFQDYFSLKVWPYRILYQISRQKVITIITIQHRQGVYK